MIIKIGQAVHFYNDVEQVGHAYDVEQLYNSKSTMCTIWLGFSFGN